MTHPVTAPPDHDDARPRLKRFVTVVPVREDLVLLHGPNLFLRVEDDDVPDLQRLLPLLDGRRGAADLARASGLPGERVATLLQGLEEADLLEDAAYERDLGVPDPARPYLDAQLAALSQLVSNPTAPTRRLAEADVLVVGLGPVGAAVADALHAAGVGRLSLLDPRPVQAWDAVSPLLQAHGATRAESVAKLLPSRHGLTRVSVAEGDLEAFRAVDDLTLGEALRGRDHVVVALEVEDATLLRRVNEEAVRLDVRWTPVVLRGPVANVGPTVVPRKKACWRCFDLRRKGATPSLDHHLVYERHHELHADRLRPAAGLLPTFGSLAGAFAANEVILSVSGVAPPSLRGAVLVVDLLQGVSRRHRVLRMPRCPACGDATTPELDRYDLEPVPL